MIRFFRQIRQRLLTDNKFSKYLLYAVGEILLVVIGILIALQVDNWNEGRKQKEQFNLALEQAYNNIDIINQQVVLSGKINEENIASIDKLLNEPESIPDEILPFVLYYVDQTIPLEFILNNNQQSELNRILNPDPNDLAQIQLTKEIYTYFNFQLWTSNQLEGLIKSILYKAGIPEANVITGLSSMDNFSQVDTQFFTKEDLVNVRNLVNSPEMRQALKSLKSNREGELRLHIDNTLSDGISIQRFIKKYYPQVRLLYEEVGIIGTAIDGYVDTSSTPMALADPERSIWKTELSLTKGTVKFRTRDSWNQNWGGSEFPNGKAVFFGGDIPVTEGRYRITLNLSEKTYDFEKIE